MNEEQPSVQIIEAPPPPPPLTRAQTIEAVRRVFVELLESLRASEREMCEELELRYDDPVADCRVTIEEDGRATAVVFSFDGAGYQHFSLDADYLCSRDPGYRTRIGESLAAIGASLYAEDRNNWSMAVWL